MTDIYYSLGLHMHQPPGNMDLLIESNEWEAQQIIRCYERAARYAHMYKNDACLHVGFSGILLRQFKDPKIIDRYRKFVDIPEMIEMYKQAKNIELIGMGFYHPIFPLIPEEDWPQQLQMGIEIAEEMFGRRPRGFWPSEMAFSMEMIPALVKAGYEYVVVDHVHVSPLRGEGELDCFKPYIASHKGADITVVPRNRDISNAQESGMDAGWFLNEVKNKVSQYPCAESARLVTTWSDGENGGWFRQMDERAGFFGHFFSPLMEKIQVGETEVRLMKISEFIKRYPAKDSAFVRTGAWNVASTSGYDFSQWNGSETQKKAVRDLFDASSRYWSFKLGKAKLSGQRIQKLNEARRFILDAETSCYLFWGDAWLPKIYDKLNEANKLLSSLET